MRRVARFIVVLLVAALFVFPTLTTAECLANSGEPPSILIIVSHAPDDLEISLWPEDVKGQKDSHSYETYYYFYYRQLQTIDYTFKVTTGDDSFLVKLERPLESYHNIYVLDLKNQELSPGKPFSRSAFLIFSRVGLTLLVEGLLFFLFGYRQKRSWLVFLGVNLVTQLVLWMCLNGTSPFHAGYIIFALFFAEILIYIIELTSFLVLVNEHHRLRTAFYVTVANILSFVVGAYLLAVLPI